MTFSVLAACGGPQGGAQSAAGTEGEVSCPAPIGTTARENFAEISSDFGALNVDGALKTAGSSKGADERIEAIKAAGDLATRLKERRVQLCTDYNACKMSVADHNAEDDRLAGLMAELIKAWDERNFQDADGPNQLKSRVKALAFKFDGQAEQGPGPASPAEVKPAVTRVPGDKLSQVTGAGLTFTPAAGRITVAATTDGARDVLKASAADLHASGGSRYLINVAGSYTPASPSLIKPGDDLTVRFKYRAAQLGSAYVALRSLEDPEASESTSTFEITKLGSGEQQVTLTAVPGSSGFYVGIGSKTLGLELDDIEVARGGGVIATAQAESAKEANVESTCKIGPGKAISGKGSFSCAAGPKDVITIGRPQSHMFISVRTGSGEDRSILRMMSLEGGRSIDAKISDDSSLVIGLVGPGSAVIQDVQVKKL
jgi:hypothetical protein